MRLFQNQTLFILLNVLCCTGVFASFCSNACALQLGNTLKKTPLDSTQKIEEVVIVGNRIQREVIPVQILEGKQLKSLSVHSVADALRYFSGVQIKDYGGVGGLKTVNVRSMGSNHVGVFYDGVELGNAQNGVVDLGRFSLDNMESVTVYNGQKSAIFQPAKDYASSSALYLTTRTPRFNADKANNFSISLNGGSFETVNPSFLWEKKISRNLSTSLSTEYMYTSGRYKFSYAKKNGYDTTEVRKNGEVKALRVEAGLYGTIKDGEWKAKLYFYDSGRGYPGASVREEPGKFKHQDRQWDDNFFLQSSLRKNVGKHYSILLNGKYAYDYLHYLSDPRLDVSTMYVNNKYRQQEVYLSAAHLFSISPVWSISVANDYQMNSLRANLVNFVYPFRQMLLSSAATSVRIKRLMMQASILHTYVNDKTKQAGANASSKSVMSTSVVASYGLLKDHDFNLRAFYKRAFRMPTLNDLYYTFIGNKDLNPEFTTQYDVGLTYSKTLHGSLFRSIMFQADGYFNQVEDKIVAMPTSNQFRWTMMNLGYVEIRGIDVAAEGGWSIGRVILTTRLTYTYQKAQDFTEKGSEYYGGQIPYIPWNSGSVILSGSYNSWSWNYSFIYTGERYEAVANIPENYAQPWYTHDTSVTKSFRVKNSEFTATLEVNNLLNQQYEVVKSYPMPGTNFKIKLNVRM